MQALREGRLWKPLPHLDAAKPEPAKPDVPDAKIVSRLAAPADNNKWVLAEFPTTGDYVELDSAGVLAYARNFNEACVRPTPGSRIDVAVRGREPGTVIRSFIGDGGACAAIFDEPFVEVKLPLASTGGQFGLQRASPYVAVCRLQTASLPLRALTR